MQKRIAAIHDLSCLGKCSLSVVLPVLSALGAECVALPTALLPAHFAALPGVEARPLTGEMEEILSAWIRGGVTFDGVFSGYLAGPEQCGLVLELAERTLPSGLLVVDPAMADRGRLYHGYDHRHVEAMEALCRRADVIVPNLTESALLLGEEPKLEGWTGPELEALVRRLGRLGPARVAVTGIVLEAGEVAVACLDGQDTAIFRQPLVPGHYNGAGDLFASVVTGAMVQQGLDFLPAVSRAMAFTSAVAAATAQNPCHRPYGLDFEPCLPRLLEMLNRDGLERSDSVDLRTGG